MPGQDTSLMLYVCVFVWWTLLFSGRGILLCHGCPTIQIILFAHREIRPKTHGSYPEMVISVLISPCVYGKKK